MTTVKVKFRPSSISNCPGRIIYQVTRNREVRQITTDYKVYPEEWDNKHSMIVPASNNKNRSNIIKDTTQKLYYDIEQIHKIIARFDILNIYYSASDVIAEFQKITKENTLFKYMEAVIIQLQELKRTSTANNYRATLNSFKRFLNGSDIHIELINKNIIENYQAYLKSTEIAPNSISFYMRILRAVYNRAIEQGISQDKKPFRAVFTGMEKTLKRAISIHEIKRIKELNLSQKPKLEFARDIFLFLFFCRGMSFIDAVFLKKKDIKNNILTYRRHKTKQLMHIKIIDEITDIIDKYTIADSAYLFPFIINYDIDYRKQYEAALRRTNNALKDIADIIKLPVPLTTYVARHSWATIAKSKNIPVNVISDALGHNSISTTQIYLASIDSATIDKANDLIVKSV